jgi:hypothetical protein
MEAILEEIERRNALSACIDAALGKHFFFSLSRHDCIKRGTAHAKIADALGVILNNELCRLVTGHLKARGVVPAILHGDLIFRGVLKREESRAQIGGLPGASRLGIQGPLRWGDSPCCVAPKNHFGNDVGSEGPTGGTVRKNSLA